MLSGYKTYLTAALGVILTGALGMGYIDQNQYDIILGVLASFGLAFLRAGVTKSGPNQ
jgi:hypothetical protein